MKKYGLKAFGVSLMAVLGLMALFAVYAQAENLSNGGVAGHFKVLGSEPLASNIPIVGTVLSGILLIGSKNAFVECAGGTIKAGSQIINSNEGLGVIVFEGCKTFEDKKNAEGVFPELKACDVLGEPASTGKIEATGVALPKLHEGKLFILFEGEKVIEKEKVVEKPFATIKFGEECGIGVKVAVSGSVVAEVDNGNEALDHLLTFSEAIQRLFQKRNAVTDAFEAGDRLLYGAAEAFITGVAHVQLGGEKPEHKDKNWSVV